VPLPLAEVWEELQAEVERLAGEAGLRILHGLLEDEVRQRVGPPHRPHPVSGALRWGRQPGYVVFSGQKIPLQRPRVRRRDGAEVELGNYRKLQQDGRM
jgi:putative transposase